MGDGMVAPMWAAHIGTKIGCVRTMRWSSQHFQTSQSAHNLLRRNTAGWKGLVPTSLERSLEETLARVDASKATVAYLRGLPKSRAKPAQINDCPPGTDARTSEATSFSCCSSMGDTYSSNDAVDCSDTRESLLSSTNGAPIALADLETIC